MKNIFYNKIKEDKENNKLNPNKESIKITLTYGVYGILWIILSDRIVAIISKDTLTYMRYQTFKGWFYVLFTMSILYVLIHKSIKKIEESNKALFQAYIDIQGKNLDLLSIDTQLQFQKNLNQNIIDISPVIIFTMNSEAKLVRMNTYGLRLFEYIEEDLVDKNWIEVLVTKEDRSKVRELLNNIIENSHSQSKYMENSFITKTGDHIDLLWSLALLDSLKEEKDNFVVAAVDITEKNKYEEKIRTMAFFDKLTGLPNKAMLENEVERILNVKDIKPFCIVYIDIDNFKYINDTYGHQVGDKFLKHIGSLLEARIKSPHFVARISGDEFVVVTELTSEESIIKNIGLLKESLGNTWDYENYRFYISMSIGIVSYPKDGEDINTLLKNAEIAMYAAKQQGKNIIVFYEEYMDHSNTWYIDMAHKVQLAIDNKEFSLVYQPQYEVKTNKIFGAEALVRWDHPHDGFISPGDFIPIAEKTGQIFRLEQWILENALKQKQQWELNGLAYINLSINLSAKTLISDKYFKSLEDLLTSYDLDYSNLTIEITETSIISNLDLVIQRLKKLKTRGLKIALDDFGTGYSSLTYLTKLPIDIIKLEKSFIDLIFKDEKDSLIVKSILRLANDLNFIVIAEGVETQEQLEYLARYNCPNAQGFFLSKPLPEPQATDLFIKNKDNRS